MTNTDKRLADIKETIKQLRDRLNNAREFNWTGGFEQHYFEEWVEQKLATSIHQALAEDRARVVEEARQTLKKEDSDIVEKVIASLPLTDNKKDNE